MFALVLRLDPKCSRSPAAEKPVLYYLKVLGMLHFVADALAGRYALLRSAWENLRFNVAAILEAQWSLSS